MQRLELNSWISLEVNTKVYTEEQKNISRLSRRTGVYEFVKRAGKSRPRHRGTKWAEKFINGIHNGRSKKQ